MEDIEENKKEEISPNGGKTYEETWSVPNFTQTSWYRYGKTRKE